MGKQKNIKGRSKVRWGRLIGTVGLISLIAAGSYQGVKKIISIHDKSEIIDVNELENESEVKSKYDAGIYDVKVDIPRYVISEGDFLVYEKCPEMTKLRVFDNKPVYSKEGAVFYYSENYDRDYTNNKQILYISKSDLEKNTQLVALEKNIFEDISVVTDGAELYRGLKNEKSVKNIKPDEIVFVDRSEIEFTDEKAFLRVRTNDGQIGYMNANEVVPIPDGNIVEIVDPAYGDYMGNRAISVKNQNGLETIISVDLDGDYFVSQVPHKSVAVIEHQQEEEKLNVESLNEAAKSWNQDITSGYRGIDLYFGSTHPNDLENFLNENKDIKYATIKIGKTIVNSKEFQLDVEECSSFDNENTKKTKALINILKNHEIPIFAYYYDTSVNIEEAEVVVQNIEDCIDALGGGLIPIIDYENTFKENDRLEYYSGVNLASFRKMKENKGETSWVNLEEMKKENEAMVGLERYLNEHPIAKEYFYYDLAQKTDAMAYKYSKLYKDGYYNTKDIIIYAGAGAVADSKGRSYYYHENGTYDYRVGLFDFKAVEEKLKDENSPFFIAKDVCVQQWDVLYGPNNGSPEYAKEITKLKMDKDGPTVAMVQYTGNLELRSGQSVVDLNYASPATIDVLLKATEKLNPAKINEQYQEVEDYLQTGEISNVKQTNNEINISSIKNNLNERNNDYER